MKDYNKTKLLYIVSLGHSGSTLLDLLSGTIKGVFSMGEAHFLSWQLLQGEIIDDKQTYCSCGENFNKCAFIVGFVNIVGYVSLISLWGISGALITRIFSGITYFLVMYLGYRNYLKTVKI